MKGSSRQPPALARAILRSAAPPGIKGSSAIGDLHEEWEERHAESQTGAWTWYWGAALLLSFEFAIHRLWNVFKPNKPLRSQGLRMELALQDLKLAVRSLAKRPFFAFMAIASLAVGIGANTAIFSAVNRLVLKPLPGITGQDQIIEIGRTSGGNFGPHSYPDFLDIRGETETFEQASGWLPAALSLTLEEGQPGERMGVMYVSANYFSTLGVTPFAGRFFVPEEDTGIGEHPVVVVSHRFWEEELGSDPDAVGRTLLLNRELHTVLGVAAPAFRSHMVGLKTELWLPLMQSPELRDVPERLESRGMLWFHVLARLTPGTTVAQGDAAVRTIFRRLEAEYPESNARRTAGALPLGPIPGGGRDGAGIFLTVLTALVGLLLLVTCANVAGMLLSRAAARKREIAVRTALGSGRARLVTMLGTEAMVLFVLGGAGGLLLASWLLSKVTLSAVPVPFPLELDLSIDLGVLAFTLVLTLITGLLFGTLPALQFSKPNLVPSLKDEATNAAPATLRLRRVFVSAQVGFSLLLMASAGLFLRSLQAADEVASGFEPDGVVMTALDISMEGYDTPEQGLLFFDELLARVEAIPGASGAAISRDLPLDMQTSDITVALDHRDPEDRSGYETIGFNRVSRDYMDVLSIPLLQGRGFEASDTRESPKVAVISRAFAEEGWPDQNPVGRSFLFGSGDGDRYTIVGVAEDVKNAQLTENSRPFAYFLNHQNFAPDIVVTAAIDGPFEQVAPALRSAILDVDPSLSMTPVTTLAKYTGVALLPQKIAASITSVLGVIALGLSGLGIYGVIAYSVMQRTREIGIRMALGADRGLVVANVVRGALMLALPGLLIGAAASLAAGPLLRSLLIGISPMDPVALTTVAAILLGVVGIASLVPAARASRVEPVESLRCE